MSTTINGHELTDWERATLDIVLREVRRLGGDTGWTATASPLGDGRAVDLYDVFPLGGSVLSNRRKTVYALAAKGVLAACEVEYRDGQLKAVPLHLQGQPAQAASAVHP